MVISVLEKTLEKASKFIGRISYNSFASFSSSNKFEKINSNENDTKNNEKDSEAPRKKLKNNLKNSTEVSSVTSTKSSSSPFSELEESSSREMSSSVFHLAKSLSAISLLMDGAKNSFAIVYSPCIQTVLKRKESTSTLSVFTALQALGKNEDVPLSYLLTLFLSLSALFSLTPSLSLFYSLPPSFSPSFFLFLSLSLFLFL